MSGAARGAAAFSFEQHCDIDVGSSIPMWCGRDTTADAIPRRMHGGDGWVSNVNTVVMLCVSNRPAWARIGAVRDNLGEAHRRRGN